jgi:hypothetical protein
VITVAAEDQQHNRSDTSYVPNFIEDVAAPKNTAPAFNTKAAGVDGNWEEQTDITPDAYTEYNFNVSDAETQGPSLSVTATSSNAYLVPNDAAHLAVGNINSNGYGKVRITPLALPSPGAPQATTITLTVSDPPQATSLTRASYNKRMSFLFVVRDPSNPIPMFLRPSGVFNFNPNDTDEHMDKTYVTGEVRGISWRQLEPTMNDYEFDYLNGVFGMVPDGQVLSLNIQEQPCYIAESLDDDNTWCDPQATVDDWHCDSSLACTHDGISGILRAVPWDIIRY